ncbi:MAG: oligosaccharide flippase family protein [Luteibacter sp.]|uniref:lipopolysaccharide biosynthesis protein n=1 Tax=Luteibacter sp. TaxID=1886636 RepID=UPI00280A10A8|nr:oligosaccharide flippase family protein [Luteibacter sp.]MDQ7997142.1 oligosaccharide flippase family protein [Luteibacter sp.]MDQ8049792.1 oligosaccharide flippase family protein [Luteibacter sp.]
MSSRQIASNVVALYAIQGMQYVFPLLVLPIVTRAIGPDRYGVLSFWQALAALLTLLVEYGFNYTSVRALNRADSDEDRSAIFWSTVWARMLLLIPATAILVCTALVVSEKATGVLVFATWLPVLAAAISPAWYYVATRRNVAVAAISAGASLVAVIATLLLVRDASDLNRAALIQMGLPLAAAAMMLVWQKTRMDIRRPHFATGDVQTRFREGLPLFVMTLSAGAYSAFNPFLLGLVTTSPQVADFALGERLVRAAKNAVQPLLTLMYPYAVEGDRSSSATRANLRRAAIATLGASMAIALLLAVCAPLAVWLISGTGYPGAVTTTRLLSINVAVITAGHLIGVQYLVVRGKERLVAVVTMTAAPLHVVAFLWAGHRFGATGGSVAYVAVECLVTLSFGLLAVKLARAPKAQ